MQGLDNAPLKTCFLSLSRVLFKKIKIFLETKSDNFQRLNKHAKCQVGRHNSKTAVKMVHNFVKQLSIVPQKKKMFHILIIIKLGIF